VKIEKSKWQGFGGFSKFHQKEVLDVLTKIEGNRLTTLVSLPI
jgi:hypothetical protein